MQYRVVLFLLLLASGEGCSLFKPKPSEPTGMAQIQGDLALTIVNDRDKPLCSFRLMLEKGDIEPQWELLSEPEPSYKQHPIAAHGTATFKVRAATYSLMAIDCEGHDQGISTHQNIASPTTVTVDARLYQSASTSPSAIHLPLYPPGGGAPEPEPTAGCLPPGAHATLASQCCNKQLAIPTSRDPSNRCHE